MNGEPLAQGRAYNLLTRQKNVIWPGRQIVYVRREVLPSIGGEWETFYSVFGGTLWVGAESGIANGILQRIRMKPEDLYVRGDKILGKNIVASLIIDETHSPIVQSWLDEVERIKQAPMKNSRFEREAFAI